VHDLGVPSPHIGQLIAWSRDGDTTYYLKLVGVTKDFHFASMKNEIKPFAFIMNNNRVSNLTLKLSSQNMPSAMDGITRQWKAVAPGRPLQYFFLDETYARLYQSETNFQKLFFVLVVLSIVIACLGLFGLAAFTAQQRTKEIGIRKVLGASVAGITALLSRDFLKLVLISVVIATPVTWWAMSRWLDNYTYRIQISWLVFIMAGILAVIIALATVSFQSLRSAMMNPVTSLRSE
jgi:putative ABC transport system permease protein